ncbi:hypothetical protein MASR2M15_27950 [Anaerolineales bacterium]
MRKILIVLLCLTLFMINTTIFAQDRAVTLLVPDQVKTSITPEMLANFRNETGIRVVLKSTSDIPSYSPNVDMNTSLDEMKDFANSADVMALTTSQISPEFVRSGLFLDLTPLTSTDTSLYPEDFYPQMWQSLQWDGGIWGLPISADPIVLIYNPEAFDNMGLSYPDANWTIYDLDNAIRQLTEYDENGNVAALAFVDIGGVDLMMLSLSGASLIDPDQFPSQPKFDDPNLEEAMTVWSDLAQEGFFTLAEGQDFAFDSPMYIGQSIISSAARFVNQSGGELKIALLPGGAAGIQLNFVAVSAGTQDPEAAYEVAKYLTNSPELAQAFFGTLTARKSLSGASVGEESPFRFLQVPEDQIPVLEEAMTNALPYSDTLFSSYLNTALRNMTSQNIDAATALDDAELLAIENMQIAQNRAVDMNLFVAAPAPEVQLSGGVISLKFGYQSFTSQFPNQAEWDLAIEEFVTQDPEVGYVTLETASPFTQDVLTAFSNDFDCFYMPSNAVRGGDVSKILAIDPLLASDPNFSANDIVGNLLQQVQRDNLTYAMPVILQPGALYYNPLAFSSVGAYEPYRGWNVADFEDALRTIGVSAEGVPPFASKDFGGNYLLVFIAAYGGLPIDYRTSPITIDFTNPANLDAIQQVLDLAKDGYLAYEKLSNLFSFGGGGQSTEYAMYSQLINSVFQFGGSNSDETTNYQLATMPAGFDLSAVSYDIGALYISSQTQLAEPCYRFMSFIASQTGLFDGMPVRRSQINDPQLANTVGNTAIEFYLGMDDLLSSPDTILIPTIFSGDAGVVGDFLISYWLFRAFDRYVLEDADLVKELEEAEGFAKPFQECIAGIPAFDPANNNQLAYLQLFLDCAIKVDPSTESLFPRLG